MTGRTPQSCPGCNKNIESNFDILRMDKHAPECQWVIVAGAVAIQFTRAVCDGGLIDARKVRQNADDLWAQGVRPPNSVVDLDKLSRELRANFFFGQNEEEIPVDVTLYFGPFDGHRMKLPGKAAQLFMMRDLKEQPILATALERAQNVTHYYTKSKVKPTIFIYGGPIVGEDV